MAIALLLAACDSGGNTSPGSGGEPGAAANGSSAAPLDIVYKFDSGGSLPLTDRSELPAVPGSVLARWYTFEGWYVVALQGLDTSGLRPLCIGTSVFNVGTGQVEHPTHAATGRGGCDDRGAGPVPLADPAAGLRRCKGPPAVISQIPADISGTLFANIMAFLDDGTGVAVASRVAITAGTLPEIDASWLDCGLLPAPHVLVPPTPTATQLVVPTPAPPGPTASVGVPKLPPTPRAPGECRPASTATLQDVTTTAAGPYLVHHPRSPRPDTPTIIFLGGGTGSRNGAYRSWQNFLGEGKGLYDYRIVLPYAAGADFIDEARRTFAIWHEVLSCYGGDPARVHLGGASNGGLAAFALMVTSPEYFATLLGAPGAFPVQDPTTVSPESWREMLAGKAVFNGVGAFDSDWKTEVIATHNSLVAAGIESVFVEFRGQGHIVSESFDESVFAEFWRSH